MKKDEILEIIENLLALVLKRDDNITRLLTKIEGLETEVNKSKGKQNPTGVQDNIDISRARLKLGEREGVFLVDDCPVMQRILKDLVQHSGLTVVGEAYDGIDALRLFMTIKPKVAIVDIDMPRMNGLDLTKKLKEIDPEIKVIIISGIMDKSTVLTALNYGACEYLVKPVKPARILNALQEVMAEVA